MYDNTWKDTAGVSRYSYNGNSLYGKTVGIVGLGSIGLAIAERMRAFKVEKVLYTSRTEKAEAAAKVGAEYTSFEKLLQESDVIIIACSLNPSTQEMFNAEAFKKMKKTAALINVSRGKTVDQDALIAALKKGEICTAGLDVMTPEPLPTDHELLKMDNVTLTPHMGSSSGEGRDAAYKAAVENLLAALEGRKMPVEVY